MLGGPGVHGGLVEAEQQLGMKRPSWGWSWRRWRSPRVWWKERRLEEMRTKRRADLVNQEVAVRKDKCEVNEDDL